MSILSDALHTAITTGGEHRFSEAETAEIHRDFARCYQESIEEIRQQLRKEAALNPHSIMVD